MRKMPPHKVSSPRLPWIVNFRRSASRLIVLRTLARSAALVTLVALMALISFPGSSASSIAGLLYGDGPGPGATTSSNASGSASTTKQQFRAFLKAASHASVGSTAELQIARRAHTATTLSDGRILIAGGENSTGQVEDSEVYDPNDSTFSLSAKLNIARANHSATKLADGRIIIIGGHNRDGSLTSTELFDSQTNVFSPGPSLVRARSGHTATRLADGKILIAGGDTGGTAEIFDLDAMKFTLLSSQLVAPRSSHSAILLKSGRVLIAGGLSSDGTELRSAEIFDPESFQFTSTHNSMAGARTRPTLRELPDGKVQVIGGDDERSIEMFNTEREYFTARARLVSESDSEASIADVLRTTGRAAVIDNRTSIGTENGLRALGLSSLDNLLVRGDALAALLDRSDHTITEIPERGTALITGGKSSRGATLMSTSTTSSSGATVTTNKTDYAPGETVVISGSEWLAGETVRLILHRDNDTPDTVLSAVAGADGKISNSDYVVQASDLNLAFLLTAVGQTSGYTALTSFTDAGTITSVTLNGGSSVSVAPGATITAVINVTTGIGGGDPNWRSSSWQIDTTPGSANCIDHANHDGIGNYSETLTITAPGSPGTYNAYFTAYQDDGCSIEPSAIFTLSGGVVVCGAPGVTCPAPTSASANAGCQAAVPNVTGSTIVSGGCGPFSVTQSPTAGTLVGLGTHTITVTATNAAGQSATCTTSFTVNDNTPPSITTCAPNQSASANATCRAAVPNFTAGVVATDNCTAAGSLTITQSPAAGTLLGVGFHGITITVKDAANNQSTCVAFLTVNDNTAPSITTCAANQSASANASCRAAVPNFTAGVVATDNCTAAASLTITQSPAAGTLLGVGFHGITITVKDAANNQSTCVAFFTVNDNTAPSITTCAANQSASANASCRAAVPNFTASVVATDNCTAAGSLTITQSPTAGTLLGVGFHGITITVKDAANNQSTCTANFTVTDNSAPSITTCAANQSASANASCQAAVPNFTAGVVATDNCTAAGLLSITQSPAAGTLVGVGVHNITITVKDAGNNQSTCLATFTVNDVTPPTITTCAPNQSASANATCQATVPNFTAGVVATDNCSAAGLLSITQSPAAGTLVGEGVHNITITVKDAANNQSNCIATFTVTDTTPPSITTCAPNQAANADANCQAAVPNFTAGVVATDNCTVNGSLLVTQSPTAGTLVSDGIHNITITVKDAAGNQSTCTATFTVTDTTPPSINTCATNQSASANASCQAAVPSFTAGVGATDNCTGAGSLMITQSPTAGTLVGDGVHNITITVKDAAGNQSTCVATFTVTDDAGPSITTCAANQSASANAGCQAAVPDFTAVVATDNCTAAPSLVITQSPTAGTLVGDGVHNITVTVTDAAGNQSTCNATFTVTDHLAPSITTCAASQVASEEAGCQATVPDFTAGVVASDNCTAAASLVITQSPTAGTLVGVGVHNITITVKDSSNNCATCVATFTVGDNTPPAITACAANQSAAANASCQATVPNFTAGVIVADGCGPGSLMISQSPTAGTIVGVGVHNITITVTDAANNSSNCVATFTVTDSTAPVITTCPANQWAFGGAGCQAVVPDFCAGIVATDNCTPAGSLMITQSPVAGTVVGVGPHTITITVTDAANNSTTCTAIFTVKYNFAGFFQPVDNPPSTNLVKAGQSVPMKFQLTCGGNFVSDFSVVTGITSVNVVCSGTTETDPIPADDSWLSGLHYDYNTNQFIYIWKTDKSWADKCRKFILTLSDGSIHEAYFQFK